MHSPARQAQRVFLVTAIRPHGVRSQTLMLAGLNGELILFGFMLGFILHPNLPGWRFRHALLEGNQGAARGDAISNA